MNFNSMNRHEQISLELKYCERCGGLWVRQKGVSGVYCSSCRARLAALMRAHHEDGVPERKGPNSVRIDCLRGVAEMEVRA